MHDSQSQSLLVITILVSALLHSAIMLPSLAFDRFTHQKYDAPKWIQSFGFPVIYTSLWTLYGSVSPIGTWGDPGYMLSHIPCMTGILAIGGLPLLNFSCALFGVCVANWLGEKFVTNRELVIARYESSLSQPLLGDTDEDSNQTLPTHLEQMASGDSHEVHTFPSRPVRVKRLKESVQKIFRTPTVLLLSINNLDSVSRVLRV